MTPIERLLLQNQLVILKTLWSDRRLSIDERQNIDAQISATRTALQPRKERTNER